MNKTLGMALVALALAGCAAYKPVPDGYAGPVANVSDSGFPEDAWKAQIFAMVAIDGNRLPNSFDASARASQNQGFNLNTRLVARDVPARPMKVLLRGSHATGAPIHAMFSQARGTFFSVEGPVDFTPKPNGRYAVKGELRKEGSSVWIEDLDTRQPATEKIVNH